MGLYFGFDPGGAGDFGWCVVEGDQLPLHLVARGVDLHAQAAFQSACSTAAERTVLGVGIDAPLFWRSDGDRRVDRFLRTKIVELGAHGGTVNAVNSMQGACLVQGMLIGMLVRKVLGPSTCLTESHPKAALWLLRIANRDRPPTDIRLEHLGDLFVGNLSAATDHERDAAVGALSAFAMTHCLRGWHDLYPLEFDALSPIQPPPGYWLPES